MKNILKSSLITVMLLIVFSCSKSDDEDNDSKVLDNLYQTEWEGEGNNKEYSMYFSTADNYQVSMWHPKIMPNGSMGSVLILGTYSYSKPNFTLKFNGECSSSGFVFSNCNATGKVEGNTIKVTDKNGEIFKFVRIID
jgi:hypothetical protein